jgi:hypothetical protein
MRLSCGCMMFGVSMGQHQEQHRWRRSSLSRLVTLSSMRRGSEASFPSRTEGTRGCEGEVLLGGGKGWSVECVLELGPALVVLEALQWEIMVWCGGSMWVHQLLPKYL